MWRLRRYRIQILVLLIATLLLVRVSLYLLLPDPASRLNGGFSQIKMGMTPGEVEHILGKPNKDDPDVKVWVSDTCVVIIVFEDGRVTDKDIQPINLRPSPQIPRL
jgi:hypothetical protein